MSSLGYKEDLSGLKFNRLTVSKFHGRLFKYKDGRNNETLPFWECLIDCAEYICNVRGLKTKPLQIKKNVSACLHNKRASCHGYTFKLEEA